MTEISFYGITIVVELDEERNAALYSPRVINGSVMETTYDHATTKKEIKNKNSKKLKLE